MIDWQPIATMPANEMVLLGWQGWPLVLRGSRNTFIPDSGIPDELWGFVPKAGGLPHGQGFRLEAFPPTHWARINYPTGEQVKYPVSHQTGSWKTVRELQENVGLEP